MYWLIRTCLPCRCVKLEILESLETIAGTKIVKWSDPQAVDGNKIGLLVKGRGSNGARLQLESVEIACLWIPFWLVSHFIFSLGLLFACCSSGSHIPARSRYQAFNSVHLTLLTFILSSASADFPEGICQDLCIREMISSGKILFRKLWSIHSPMFCCTSQEIRRQEEVSRTPASGQKAMKCVTKWDGRNDALKWAGCWSR